MITNMGEGLNVLICTDATPHNDWMAFGTWYSFYRNLPQTEITIACARQKKVYNFGWIYRCAANFFQHKNYDRNLNKLFGVYQAIKKGMKQPILVVEDNVMAIRPFVRDTLKFFENNDYGIAGPVWYFNNHTIEMLEANINTYGGKDAKEVKEIPNICRPCGDDESCSLTHYEDQCGNFSLKNWKSKYSVSPFGYADRFKSMKMTVSENKVLELWRQAHSLYEALK